ncbi:MAG: alpha/beta hydrolase [Devosia sp.]
MKLLRRIAITLVVALVLAYLGGMAALYVLQRGFQYDPEGRVIELSETTLRNTALVVIPTSDDATVTGWFAPPAAGKPLIVYYKGNADSFSSEHIRFEAFAEDGYGFLAIDYRGFPASPGEITQQHVLDDAIAAFDWARAKGYPLVIWGRSLGSGPASFVASEREAQALYLETPFDSAVSVGQERYWFFPVGLLMKDQFPVDQWILKVEEPVFVALAQADKTIPYHHGQRAYDLAPNKAGLWIEEGAGHSDLWKAGEWEAHARPFFEATARAQ